jgi:hypothetical protein
MRSQRTAGEGPGPHATAMAVIGCVLGAVDDPDVALDAAASLATLPAPRREAALHGLARISASNSDLSPVADAARDALRSPTKFYDSVRQGHRG